MIKKKIKNLLAPAAFVLGIILGLILPQFSDTYKAIGSVYTNLLKLLALPILMCMIFNAVVKTARKIHLLGKVLAVFFLMFAVTFLLTALVCATAHPGYKATLTAEVWEGETTVFSLKTFIGKIIPSNLFSAMASGDFLPCILIAAALGLAARKNNAANLQEWVSDFEKVLLTLLEYVMRFTPLGVFFLMAAAASADGASVIGTGLKYILFAWGCSLLAFFAVMLLPVCVIRKMSPVVYCKKVRRVILNTLSTCSSAATLPITIDVCRKEFDIDEEICGVTAPLGCTIHMCGGAVSFCLLAFFTFQSEQMSISCGLFLLMLLAAEVINMAAPGIPGGGIVIGASYLSLLGAPLNVMGMYSGIYRFLDMAYTTMNVLGDITANVIVQKLSEGKTKNDAQQ